MPCLQAKAEMFSVYQAYLHFGLNNSECRALLPVLDLSDKGYVHTVPDSETERRRKCTG